MTLACGGKTELPDPEEDETGGRAGAPQSGKGGTSGTTIGPGGSSAGGGPIGAAGSAGRAPGTGLPACEQNPFCPPRCYPATADEACLPITSASLIHERLGCTVQLLAEAPSRASECCYSTGECAGVGRPLIVAGLALIASLSRTPSWLVG